jgi:tetratricopeptide (TPR) repeat protein
MRYLLVVICLLLTLNSNGQEKRLAWVIGNSNYDKGFLKNPVNDALLVAKTLKELNFTVLLDTNIATEKDFNDAVRKFGEQRANYNIGFIYYAGHGIQIKDVNYLLPTKEEYLDEYDIEDKALSVQKIMRYIEDRSSEVNVLILDACRDNPFEKNWKATGRSLEGGRGLAKANPPTGSLIAYSTDAGNIAADGSGKNSIYCLSLIKNMQIENLTLDQVFRNVRTEVLKLSENKQRPVEASQLTGEAFYLKRGTYLEQINIVDSLIKAENYTLALQEVSSILTHDAANKMALCRKGEVLMNLQGKEYDGADLFKAVKLFPNDPEPIVYLGRYYYTIDKKDEALSEYGKAIKLDSTYAKSYFYRTTIYEESKQFDKALIDYNKSIELEPKNDENYFYRAVFYRNYKKDYQSALIDFSKAIELNPKKTINWYQRGITYYGELNNNKKALEDFNKVLDLDSTNVDAINLIGLIYKDEEQLEKAIEIYERGIALEKQNPSSAAYCYRNRASIYEKQNLLDKALEDYNKAVLLDNKYPEHIYDRALFYKDYKLDYQNAVIDISKAIELKPEEAKYWYNRGRIYVDYLSNNKKALEDFNKVLELDSMDIDAINYIGVIYQNDNQLEKAIEIYERGIFLEKINPSSAAYCYRNRASIYEKQNLLDKAIADYNKAILLDNQAAEHLYARALFYIDYKEDYQNAVIDFSKAIQLNPNDFENWYARGRLYYQNLNENKKALEDFNKVLELDSTAIDAINAIGVIYQEEGQLDKSIETYNRGINLEKINPSSSAYCYRNRASVYEKQNLLVNALADYNKAIALDPTNADRYLDRADFYQDYKEDYQNALIDISKAIELSPNDKINWYRRGLLFDDYLNNTKKALEDYNKALELDSTYGDAINAIGVIYQDEGQLEKAIEAYNKGICLEKSNPTSASYCYRNRASIYEKQNLLEKALEDYNKAIILDPTNADRYSDRARFYAIFKEDYQRAVIDFSKVIELNPNDKINWYTRGFLFDNYLNNNKKALEDYYKALGLDSNYLDAINTIGLIYQEEGQLEKAIEIYDKGILLEINNPVSAAFCYNNRASIYEKQKLFDKALADYNKAISLDPINASRYIARGNFYSEYKMQYYDALVDYTLAISLDSLTPNNWWLRGRLFSDKLNNNQSAINDFKQLLKLDSNNISSINWLGIFNFRIGHYQLAKMYFELAIEKHKQSKIINKNYKLEDPFPFVNLCLLSLMNNKFDDGLSYIDNGLSYDSLNYVLIPIKTMLMSLYFNKKSEAIIYYNRILGKANTNPTNNQFISKLYFYNHNDKEAINAINKAIELSENKSIYLSERGNYYRSYKKYDLAEKDLAAAIKLDSNIVSTYHYQILLLKDKQQIQEAIKLAEQTISKFTNDTIANYLLGEIYLEQKDYLKSLKYFNNALAIMQYDSTYQSKNIELNMIYLSNTYQKVGEVYQLLGDKELPKEYYTKALEALKDEIRPDKVLKEKELQELLKL